MPMPGTIATNHRPSMMRVRGLSGGGALGQQAPLPQAPPGTAYAFSLCSILKPVVQYVPGVNDVVARYGCTLPARSLLTTKLLEHFEAQARAEAKAKGTAVESVDWYSTLLATAGPEIIAQCVCEGYRPPTPPPTTPFQAGGLGSPMVLLGLAAAAVAVAVVVSKRQAAPSPVVMMAPAPAAAPAAPSPPPKAAKSESPTRASQRRRRY